YPQQTRRIHLLDPHLRFKNSGIVHQSCHRSELRIHFLEKIDHFLLAEDIRLHGHGIASHSRDFPDDIGGGRFVFSVIDADSVAACRRKKRGGGSDASTSSSDEDHFIHGCCAYGEAELRSGHAKSTMRIRFLDASASRRSEALSGLLPWGFRPRS